MRISFTFFWGWPVVVPPVPVVPTVPNVLIWYYPRLIFVILILVTAHIL
ncbi:MAG: hypothetical protein ABID79_01065 [Elusimicrobiota bacterium]